MRGISSMATRHVLRELAEFATQQGMPAVELESVGGVDAAARVSGGEAFDLVFLAAGAVEELGRAGHVDPDSVTPLVLSRVAVAVPADDDAPASGVDGPAFPDTRSLRTALRAAAGIGYSTGPSGRAFVEHLRRWGLHDDLAPRLVQARPGQPVARLLAAGEVDLGFQQLSELVGEPGIRILGVMPPDAPIDTIFSGAVATQSSDPDGAARVLATMATHDADHIAARHCFARPETN